MTERQSWEFNTHQVRFEPPDLLLLRFVGPTRLEDARRAVEIYREVAAQQPFFAISDITKGELARDAREFLARNMRPEWYRGFVVVGANLVQRTMVRTILFALQATGRWSHFRLEFVDTEEHARAAVVQMRMNSSNKAA